MHFETNSSGTCNCFRNCILFGLCVPASYNAYYSRNGKDDLFEGGDDLL